MHLEFRYAGESYYPSDMTSGEVWGHKKDEKIYFSDVDLNGISTVGILHERVQIGTRLLLTDSKNRAAWKLFEVDDDLREIDNIGAIEFGVKMLGGSDGDLQEGRELTLIFNPDMTPDGPVAVESVISNAVVQELRRDLAQERQARKELEQKLKLVVDAMGRVAKGKLRDLFPDAET